MYWKPDDGWLRFIMVKMLYMDICPMFNLGYFIYHIVLNEQQIIKCIKTKSNPNSIIKIIGINLSGIYYWISTITHTNKIFISLLYYSNYEICHNYILIWLYYIICILHNYILLILSIKNIWILMIIYNIWIYL
jgi:hypothetical protein